MICWVCNTDLSGQCKLELQCGHSIHTECLFRSVYYDGGFADLFGYENNAHCGLCWTGIFVKGTEAEFAGERRVDRITTNNKEFAEDLKKLKKVYIEYVKERKIVDKEGVKLRKEIKKETEWLRESIRQLIKEKLNNFECFITKTSIRKKNNLLQKLLGKIERKWNINKHDLLIDDNCFTYKYFASFKKSRIISNLRLRGLFIDVLK